MIFFLLLLFVVIGCKMEEPTDQPYYDECVMVNESGVPIKVEIVEESSYVQFPTSLVLPSGERYTWIVPDFEQTKDPRIFYSPFGDEMPESAKIYFADCPSIEYSGSQYQERDPRSLSSYVFKKSDKKRWSTYIYTFTPEDYQNALKQE